MTGLSVPPSQGGSTWLWDAESGWDGTRTDGFLGPVPPPSGSAKPFSGRLGRWDGWDGSGVTPSAGALSGAYRAQTSRNHSAR